MPTLAADVLLLTATPVESKATLQAFAAATQHQATALARQGQSHEGLPYAQRAVEIFMRLKISPDDMEAAQATLRDCEASG